jgi:16S rRNA (cytidine1402-2'-O)-methyltransferase
MGMVYLIPSLLSDDGIAAIPAYIKEAAGQCQVFYVENERTARRFLKKIWKEIVIDDYEWKLMGNDTSSFKKDLQSGKTIGIISEAGCPGIADPGQLYIAEAQRLNIAVKPLSGPSSVILALMASGMNGQSFSFKGYLPINASDRSRAIKELEALSRKENSTQIFIETPYRNNQLMAALLSSCQSATQLCIATDLTGTNELIQTKTIADWKKHSPDLHKKPVIFLLYACNLT